MMRPVSIVPLAAVGLGCLLAGCKTGPAPGGASTVRLSPATATSSGVFRSALAMLAGRDAEHRVLNRSKHEMLLPGNVRYVAQRRPWAEDRDGMAASLNRRMSGLCGGDYPATTHVGRDGRQAVIVGLSNCTGQPPDPEEGFREAMAALDDAAYAIKQGHGSFQYLDAATARLEADRKAVESAVKSAALRRKHGLDEGDRITELPDGSIEVQRADGRRQRPGPDGVLADVKPPGSSPRPVPARASLPDSGGSPGRHECGYADLESTRSLYEENVALQREGRQPASELTAGFDAAWATAKADAHNALTKAGVSPQEFVRLTTQQISELDKTYQSALRTVDALGGRQAAPDCTGTESATGGAVCAASATYIVSVQTAMYCHEIAARL